MVGGKENSSAGPDGVLGPPPPAQWFQYRSPNSSPSPTLLSPTSRPPSAGRSGRALLPIDSQGGSNVNVKYLSASQAPKVKVNVRIETVSDHDGSNDCVSHVVGSRCNAVFDSDAEKTPTKALGASSAMPSPSIAKRLPSATPVKSLQSVPNPFTPSAGNKNKVHFPELEQLFENAEESVIENVESDTFVSLEFLCPNGENINHEDTEGQSNLRWSIDSLANLMPVEIDVSAAKFEGTKSSKTPRTKQRERHREQKIQEEIDEFFATEITTKSPMPKSSTSKTNPCGPCGATPTQLKFGCATVESTSTSCNVSCQTDISVGLAQQLVIQSSSDPDQSSHMTLNVGNLQGGEKYAAYNPFDSPQKFEEHSPFRGTLHAPTNESYDHMFRIQPTTPHFLRIMADAEAVLSDPLTAFSPIYGEQLTPKDTATGQMGIGGYSADRSMPAPVLASFDNGTSNQPLSCSLPLNSSSPNTAASGSIKRDDTIVKDISHHGSFSPRSQPQLPGKSRWSIGSTCADMKPNRDKSSVDRIMATLLRKPATLSSPKSYLSPNKPLGSQRNSNTSIRLSLPTYNDVASTPNMATTLGLRTAHSDPLGDRSRRSRQSFTGKSNVGSRTYKFYEHSHSEIPIDEIRSQLEIWRIDLAERACRIAP